MAIVYVRQSTQHQVMEHRESTARQYALADRATALGWPKAAVEIDEDQGRSGSSVEGRSGFGRLLTEVSSDRVGIILGLEMSRLARSCKDWHALLEVCSIYRTLLADADGLYDPSQYNDRLLLGLKGTMSEAELHILKSRLQQGMWNKAERGRYSTIHRSVTCESAEGPRWSWRPRNRSGRASAGCGANDLRAVHAARQCQRLVEVARSKRCKIACSPALWPKPWRARVAKAESHDTPKHAAPSDLRGRVSLGIS